jgi:hypothetical protein
MKITKSQLRQIIKEEMDTEHGFATSKRVLEFMMGPLGVATKEEVPDFLRWVADSLEGKQ